MRQPQRQALPVFLAQFGVALATLIVAVTLVLRVTPANELQLVREGNLAAAVWATGTVIAMAMPISAALRFSHTTGEVAAWGGLAALIQIGTYFAAAAVVGKTRQTLEAGEVPSALLVVGIRAVHAWSWGRALAASGMTAITFNHRLGFPEPAIVEAHSDLDSLGAFVRRKRFDLR